MEAQDTDTLMRSNSMLSRFFKRLQQAAAVLRASVRSQACLWSMLIHGAALVVASTVALGTRSIPEQAGISAPSFSISLARLDELPGLSLDVPEIPLTDDTSPIADEICAAPEDQIVFPDPPEVRLEFTELRSPREDMRTDWEPLESRADRRLRAEVVVPETKGQSDPTEQASPARGAVSAQGDGLSSCDAQLDKKHNKPPAYPSIARRRGWTGAVLLSVCVRADGKVKTVSVASSSGYGVLDKVAAEAVAQWRFFPAQVDGMPVESVASVRVVFRFVEEPEHPSRPP